MEKWSKKKYVLSFLSGENKERMKLVSNWQTEDYEGKPTMSNTDIMAACKELIFDLKDGCPVFHSIMYTIDVDKVVIKLEPTLDITIDPESTEDEIDEDVRNTLAIASMYDVPVYPNTKDLMPLLEKYHRKMLMEGFTAPGADGKKVRLKVTHSIEKHLEKPYILNELDLTQAYSPADLALIKTVISKELTRLHSVSTLLTTLQMGIDQLEVLLSEDKRNENLIQKCLTDNPILFGTDYAKLVPKQKLGSEFEMDYALQRYSGEYDLVEIESSNLQIYTKGGNPSQYLVHAEQQVIDWLHWIERNNSYARENLPELISPVGYIIIGRSKNLKDEDRQKLRRRNSIYRGQIVVLTYDDLIVKAKNLLAQLQVLSNEKENA